MDDRDDEMEMAEFYTGAGGSQSVDCEASPPSLQVFDPSLDNVCTAFVHFILLPTIVHFFYFKNNNNLQLFSMIKESCFSSKIHLLTIFVPF